MCGRSFSVKTLHKSRLRCSSCPGRDYRVQTSLVELATVVARRRGIARDDDGQTGGSESGQERLLTVKNNSSMIDRQCCFISVKRSGSSHGENPFG